MKFEEDKNSLVFHLRQRVYRALISTIGKKKIEPEKIIIDSPSYEEHGDYSTNIAFLVFSKAKGKLAGTPFDLASQIVNNFRSQGMPNYLAKIEVAPPGFINIWLKSEVFINQLERVIKEKEKFGNFSLLKGKRILLEHTSPNPQTTITLGHLRNNFLGMAIANILGFLGAEVIKDCVVNDRGIHICKALWGYLVFADKKSGLSRNQIRNFRQLKDGQILKVIKEKNWRSLIKEMQKNESRWFIYDDLNLKPDHANLCWYVLGSRAYELSDEVKNQVNEILIEWEREAEKCSSPRKNGKGEVLSLWRKILRWSELGYSQTYKMVGSIHDWIWYESDHFQLGKKIVEDGLHRRIFRDSQGAIVTDLAKYNLPDTIVEKADGTALYITQDLALTKLKCQKFPADLYIWCIGEEQSLYFKQLFAICEQLGIVKKEKLFHLAYALINFKGGGKMATRKGKVIMADEIIQEMKKRTINIISHSNQKLRGKISQKKLEKLVEQVAIGALKYSLLKFSRDTTIYFDIDESLTLEGNSGPYLQYTYARCQSVLKKGKKEKMIKISSEKLKPEENSVLRTIYKFPEIVKKAGENFAPNLICNYLFDLAQKYNLFYNRLPILGAEDGELKNFRLDLTAATAQVIKNGLNLLGIEALERM